MGKKALTGAIAAAGILAASCSTVAGSAVMASAQAEVSAAESSAAEAKTLAVYGELALDDSTAYASKCLITSKGYNDIRQGASVVLRDDTGRVVATGSLLAGLPDKQNSTCAYGFLIPDVPLAPFYSLEITHRGEVTFTQDELRDTPTVTLGNG